jgi:hypothetical protein
MPVHPSIRSNPLASQARLLEDGLARPGMGLPLGDVYRSGARASAPGRIDPVNTFNAQAKITLYEQCQSAIR